MEAEVSCLVALAVRSAVLSENSHMLRLLAQRNRLQVFSLSRV